jgi:hypothetical protein
MPNTPDKLGSDDDALSSSGDEELDEVESVEASEEEVLDVSNIMPTDKAGKRTRKPPSPLDLASPEVPKETAKKKSSKTGARSATPKKIKSAAVVEDTDEDDSGEDVDMSSDSDDDDDYDVDKDAANQEADDDADPTGRDRIMSVDEVSNQSMPTMIEKVGNANTEKWQISPKGKVSKLPALATVVCPGVIQTEGTIESALASVLSNGPSSAAVIRYDDGSWKPYLVFYSMEHSKLLYKCLTKQQWATCIKNAGAKLSQVTKFEQKMVEKSTDPLPSWASQFQDVVEDFGVRKFFYPVSWLAANKRPAARLPEIPEEPASASQSSEVPVATSPKQQRRSKKRKADAAEPVELTKVKVKTAEEPIVVDETTPDSKQFAGFQAEVKFTFITPESYREFFKKIM